MKLITIVGTTASGKDTIVKEILKRNKNIKKRINRLRFYIIVIKI